MSSPVSPRQRDIGEVASLRAEGVDRQPRSGFSAKIGKVATLILTNPSACGISPICAIARQRRTLRIYPDSTVFYFSRQRILIKRNGIQCRKALDAVSLR